jgi:hypothetical protein
MSGVLFGMERVNFTEREQSGPHTICAFCLVDYLIILTLLRCLRRLELHEMSVTIKQNALLKFCFRPISNFSKWEKQMRTRDGDLVRSGPRLENDDMDR